MLKVRKSGILWTTLLLITLLSLSFPAYAKYSGGTGEPNDPYQIATAEDLMLLGESTEDYDKHFILMADIDMSGYTGEEFNIIGERYYESGWVERPFTGVFDGNGHTVSNFSYTSTDRDYAGLFGFVDDPNAQIINLGLVNPDIEAGTGEFVGSLVGLLKTGRIVGCYVEDGSVSGKSIIGGLIGENTGTVDGCYSTCNVTGEDEIGGLIGENAGTVDGCYSTCNVTGERVVGGLVGQNGFIFGWSMIMYSGTISNCYYTGSTSGNEDVGGLVGLYYVGIITNCYATGKVLGNKYVGGLVGGVFIGLVEACFWDIESSGQAESAGGEGKTTAEMRTASTFLEAGWDFVGETENGSDDIWWIDEGQDYPRLWWEPYKYSGGTGDPNNPYKIATAEDLMLLGDSPDDYDKYFIMIDDIDLDPNLPGGKVFDKAVIAPDVDPNDSDFQGSSFTGVFDGNGRTISHLTITGEGYLGLFGHVGLQWDQFPTVGKITNLNIVDANITSSGDYVSGLVGNNYFGELTNCSSTGMIRGNSGVGGLVGFNQGFLSDCHGTCVVNGNYEVGGLVGWNYGNVTNSYSTGMVRGETGAGGLVGRTDSDVTDSYSTATVSGENDVGGLVGVSYSTTDLLILSDTPVFIPMNDCYNTGSVSVEENTNGIMGTRNNLRNYDIWVSVRGSFVINSFSTGVVTGKSNVGGLVGASYGPPGFVSDPWWFPPPPVPVQVTNCYSTAPVSGEEKVGGLVGYIDLYGSDVIHCYSTGSVNGSNAVGGLVGSGGGGVTACFWDVETSGQATSDGGMGKTTDEMQTASTFLEAGWDFIGETVNSTEDIWFIDEGQDYPRLWWEPSSD